ncbi:hypothetical protein DBR17_01700 [Sphingomonas sp. HMWF008]|nr:hypothetical protein DBR17_01700 [Sphingomonas sp. HMWF008]
MTRGALAYRDQLVSLSPPGRAWPRAPGSTLVDLYEALAQEFARIDARFDQLLEETDPRTAYELLGDWERVLGLPDACTAAATTLAARRLVAWRKLAYQAGQTPAFYIELAASLGFEIELHEFDPDVDDYDSTLTPLITGGRWRYVWRVHVLNAGDVSYFRAGDPAGTRLAEGDAAIDLECVLHAAKPAHTYLVISYPEEGLPDDPDAPTVSNVSGVAVPYLTPTAINLASAITGAHTTLSAGPGAKGTTSVSGDVVTYAPGVGQYGADSFLYSVSGPGGTSANATVSVTIANPPAPVANDRSGLYAPYETLISISLAGSIVGVCTSITASAAGHGTTAVTGLNVAYTPAAGYSGSDSFTFTATGPGGTSAAATVSITVLAASGGGGGGGGGGDGRPLIRDGNPIP